VPVMPEVDGVVHGAEVDAPEDYWAEQAEPQGKEAGAITDWMWSAGFADQADAQPRGTEHSAEAQRAARGAKLGRELSTAIVMFHEAVGASLGVSAGDQRALTMIGTDGPMSAGELAERTGLTPGAITGMIDRLERAGLAQREHDANDRRRVLVSATAGQPDVFGDLAAAMSDMAKRYSDAEIALIGDYLTRTIDVLRDQTRKLSAGHRPRRR
jgi:DNA-binding MarR family transcriptional regulator